MARDIVEMLELGCPRYADIAGAVMKLAAKEITKLRQELGRLYILDIDQRNALEAATERAEKAEAQRDRMREALERFAAGEGVKIAQAISCEVLKEVGDE